MAQFLPIALDEFEGIRINLSGATLARDLIPHLWEMLSIDFLISYRVASSAINFPYINHWVSYHADKSCPVIPATYPLASGMHCNSKISSQHIHRHKSCWQYKFLIFLLAAICLSAWVSKPCQFNPFVPMLCKRSLFICGPSQKHSPYNQGSQKNNKLSCLPPMPTELNCPRGYFQQSDLAWPEAEVRSRYTTVLMFIF